MKAYKYYIYLSFFITSSCAGVQTLKVYKIKHEKEYTEQVLMDLPLSYPEIAVPKTEDSIFNYFDKNYRRIMASNDTIRFSKILNNYYYNRSHRLSMDSAFFNQKVKVYYRNSNGYKIFIYTIDNGNTLCELQILNNNEDKQKCDIGITVISIKIENKRQWFGYYRKPDPKVVNALKVFNETILPKLKSKLGEIK